MFSGTPWLEEKQKEDPLVIINHILVDGGKCEGDVTIPDDVTAITPSCFYLNENLTGITIPNNITEIEGSTFGACSKLTKVDMPDRLTYIGERAFWNCNNLESIIIPDGVTRIGEGAFAGCDSLTSITWKNTTYDDVNTFMEVFEKSE